MILGKGDSLWEYFDQVKREEIGNFLIEKGDAYIAGVDTEQLTEFLYHKFALPQLQKKSREPEVERKSSVVERRNSWGERERFEQNLARVTYYFVPVHNLKLSISLNAGNRKIHSLEVDFDERTGIMSFNARTSDLEREIEYIEDLIKTRNLEIEKENEILKSTIRSQIEHRKEIINKREKEFEDSIAKIKIPLKRVDISETPLIDLSVRKSIQALREPLAQPHKEFVLDRDYVLEILDIIKRGGMQFELNPEVYGKKLDEPDLRSIILSHLNLIFEGSATGETFSKLGKSDIHLNIVEGQIFIAECKFWNGATQYRDEHINQLFRYLTWRRNYAAILTFSRNKGFSNVLSGLEQAIKEHQTYVKDFIKLDESHFQSIHSFLDDPEKEVEIHHLAFDLYANRS